MTIDVEAEDVLHAGEMDGFMAFVHTPAHPIFVEPGGTQVVLQPEYNGLWQTLRMRATHPYAIAGLVIAAFATAVAVAVGWDSEPDTTEELRRRKRRRMRTQQCVQVLESELVATMRKIQKGAMTTRALRTDDSVRRKKVKRTSRQHANRQKS